MATVFVGVGEKDHDCDKRAVRVPLPENVDIYREETRLRFRTLIAER